MVEELMTLGAKIRPRAVLFAAEDDFVETVARHKATLEERFLIPMLEWKRLRQIADKERQLELARRAGIDVPATALVRSAADLTEAAETVPFPAVLKASGANLLRILSGRKVVTVQTKDDLTSAYGGIRHDEPMLLQECVPGTDDHVLLAGTYHDVASRPLAVFTGRKLRQHPRGFGDTRAGESLWSDELADAVLAFLAAVPFHGVCDIEFKRDSRDGRLKFMEVNARQGLWSSLARAAGVNLAYVAYCDAAGVPCPTQRQIDGVRWTNLLMDAPDSLKELRRGELTPGEWLGSLRGLRVDCFLSARDPVPGLVEARRIARSHWRKWRGRH